MRRPLILVAAGGLAREAFEAVRDQDYYDVIGFIDDDARLWGEPYCGIEVLGGVDTIMDHPEAAVLLCAGNGRTREMLAGRLHPRGVTTDRYATVVHPSVLVPESCTIGSGSILLASCVLTADVRIGRHVVAMPHVTVTHDDRIADFATLCAGVTLGGGVTVDSGAFVGMNASVRQHCRIGVGATVGMGAIVLTDVPAGQTWYGCPARPGDDYRATGAA